MIKLCIVSVPLIRKGGVPNYVKLFMKNLDRDRFEVNNFELGNRKTQMWDRLSAIDIVESFFTPLIFLYQFFALIYFISKTKPDIVHLNPSLRSYRIFKEMLITKFISNSLINTIIII